MRRERHSRGSKPVRSLRVPSREAELRVGSPRLRKWGPEAASNRCPRIAVQSGVILASCRTVRLDEFRYDSVAIHGGRGGGPERVVLGLVGAPVLERILGNHRAGQAQGVARRNRRDDALPDGRYLTDSRVGEYTEFTVRLPRARQTGAAVWGSAFSSLMTNLITPISFVSASAAKRAGHLCDALILDSWAGSVVNKAG